MIPPAEFMEMVGKCKNFQEVKNLIAWRDAVDAKLIYKKYGIKLTKIKPTK